MSWTQTLEVELSQKHILHLMVALAASIRAYKFGVLPSP